jgi:hypothetical protein
VTPTVSKRSCGAHDVFLDSMFERWTVQLSALAAESATPVCCNNLLCCCHAVTARMHNQALVTIQLNTTDMSRVYAFNARSASA